MGFPESRLRKAFPEFSLILLIIISGVFWTNSVDVQASEEPSIRIYGLVDHPYNISLSEFGRLPMVTEKVSCICVGWPPEDISVNSYLVYAHDWTGVPVSKLLERAGVQKEAVDVVIHILELELLC